MTIRRNPGVAPVNSQARAIKALRVISPLIVLLVLIQAVFAGQGLFINNEAIDIHGGIANLTALFVLSQAALIPFAGFRGRERAAMIATSLLLLIMVIAQYALGISGRNGGDAAAWHVPNGVAIFGLTIVITSVIIRFRPDTDTGHKGGST